MLSLRQFFFITHIIITQIGRENDPSADIFVLAFSHLKTTEKLRSLFIIFLK
jgi:hypothetical protein